MRQAVVALLKAHDIPYTFVFLCGIVGAHSDSPDDPAACIISIHPSKCLPTKDAEDVAFLILDIFVQQSIDRNRILIQLTKENPVPYDGELGQHAVKRNFTPKDLEAPELYPGVSISRDDVYGTLACIATIQRPGLEETGPVSPYSLPTLAIPESPAVAAPNVKSPSVLHVQETDSMFYGRPRVIGPVVSPSAVITSTANFRGDLIRQDVALVEINDDQPQHKAVSDTLLRHMVFLHTLGYPLSDDDYVVLGVASGFSKGTVSPTQATVAVYHDDIRATETIEQVMLPHPNEKKPIPGDSGALVYNAPALQQQDLVGGNIDISSVALGMLWGGMGTSKDGRTDVKVVEYEVDVKVLKHEVDLSGLCFFTPFEAVLDKAVRPYLDRKYGAGQYGLSWSSRRGPVAAGAGAVSSSNGSGSGSDVDTVCQNLTGMGI
ncbi:hypothetical protein PG997_013676 [Apiospora hydei]|uniref:Uncharacterized protein n=1 Tax=Apiospora hydei TaxID=1337664 RepID=A0ABR1V6T3_9PEZI